MQFKNVKSSFYNTYTYYPGPGLWFKLCAVNNDGSFKIIVKVWPHFGLVKAGKLYYAVHIHKYVYDFIAKTTIKNQQILNLLSTPDSLSDTPINKRKSFDLHWIQNNCVRRIAIKDRNDCDREWRILAISTWARGGSPNLTPSSSTTCPMNQCRLVPRTYQWFNHTSI